MPTRRILPTSRARRRDHMIILLVLAINFHYTLINLALVTPTSIFKAPGFLKKTVKTSYEPSKLSRASEKLKICYSSSNLPAAQAWDDLAPSTRRLTPTLTRMLSRTNKSAKWHCRSTRASTFTEVIRIWTHNWEVSMIKWTSAKMLESMRTKLKVRSKNLQRCLMGVVFQKRAQTASTS